MDSTPHRARIIAAEDGPLIRWLMLEAARSSGKTFEEQVFADRTDHAWAMLATQRSSAQDHTILLIPAEQAPRGLGMLWCFAHPLDRVVQLGWWWIDPAIEGTAAERSLFDLVCEWGWAHRAQAIISASDSERETASYLRAGFVRVGLAADGERSVFQRSCP